MICEFDFWLRDIYMSEYTGYTKWLYYYFQAKYMPN